MAQNEHNNESCLAAIGRGSFKAIIAVLLPALLVIRYYDDVRNYWDGIRQLPVFQQFKNDFSTGVQIVGNEFDLDLRAFYADTVLHVSTIKEIEEEPQFRRKRSFWDRNSIENGLKQQLPSRYHDNIGAYVEYIDRYRDAAAADMQRTKIPASVTLAQGLLESNAGRSRLARQANNHFGIKCRTKPGFRRDGRISQSDFSPSSLAIDCMQAHDDYAWDRFEVYPSARESFRRHSMLLREPRYRWMLSKYEVGEMYTINRSLYGYREVPYYAAWCVGLKDSGYATARRYAEQLTLIIETYQLWRIDYETVDNVM